MFSEERKMSLVIILARAAGIIIGIGLVICLVLLVFSAGKKRDWEQFDREQMADIREMAEKKRRKDRD